MSEGESICVEMSLLILIPLQAKINLSPPLTSQNHHPSHCENYHLTNNHPINMEREGVMRVGWGERERGPRGSVKEAEEQEKESEEKKMSKDF